MKLLWTGTDSLMLVDYSMRKWYKKPYWFAFRILARILDKWFVQEHYVDAEHLVYNLVSFGMGRPIKVVRDQLNHPVAYPKRPHFGYNVIYYNPTNRRGGDKEFTRWLYGLDIIEEAKRHTNSFVNWIELDGYADMSEIYPVADMMVRPNRHDGASRIRQECEINNIPYYWTHKDPILDDLIDTIIENYVKHTAKPLISRGKDKSNH